MSLMALIALQCDCFAARTTVKQQGVVGGTKITESGTNSLIDTECQDSYFGCMDAFCIVDNISGGRCQCSNKHAELSKQLNELLDKDEQAAAISRYGADFVKLGKAKDTVLNDVEKAKTVKKDEEDNSNKTLSRADWDAMFAPQEEEEEEEFVAEDDISNKHGDELYTAADAMCIEQTPSKCKEKSEMLQMMYVQKIKSDCVAFENSIKQQNSEVNVKLADAQKSVRDAALNELQNSNKYNLGQCVSEFRNCMQTTAGCGKDFTGCVALSANDNVKQSLEKVVIEGNMVSTEISGSTMDTLLTKKVLCESVLDSCEKERDNVWNEFLKDNVIVIKTAELNAEDNLRRNCVGNISDCFVKSCREHFDVNEDEGSYDMCLARPENYKSFCKIELEPCLAATGGSYEEPETSALWQGVLSKLSAMRIDACTTEFKACIQDKDRCGEDLSQCIGLDYYDIVDICPEDKLTACYKEYNGKKETVEDTLATLAQGLMLGVESALYEACQKAVSEAMLKNCGDEDNCNEYITRDNVGARTLEIKYCEQVNGEYTNCKQSVKEILDTEIGKTVRNSDLSRTKNERRIFSGVIKGKILWEHIEVLPDSSGVISGEEYIKAVRDVYPMDAKMEEKIQTEVGALSNAIKNTINMIESDPKVQYCMTGRQVSGLKSDSGFEQIIGKEQNKLFPNLTHSIRTLIVNGALAAARDNYNKKYESLVEDYVDSNSRLKQRYAEIDQMNEHLNEEDIARRKCMEFGEREALIQDDYRAFKEKEGGGEVAGKIVRDHGNDGKLVGWSSESMWNYKLQVTTTFNLEKMICTKCLRKQECLEPKSDYCRKWKDETEECTEYQY